MVSPLFLHYLPQRNAKVRFYKSRLAAYPRRTCEALKDQTFYGLWVEKNPLPENVGFDELVSWVQPLVEAENSMGKSKDQADAYEAETTK